MHENKFQSKKSLWTLHLAGKYIFRKAERPFNCTLQGTPPSHQRPVTLIYFRLYTPTHPIYPKIRIIVRANDVKDSSLWASSLLAHPPRTVYGDREIRVFLVCRASPHQHAQVQADVVCSVVGPVHEACVAQARRNGDEQDPEGLHHEPAHAKAEQAAE